MNGTARDDATTASGAAGKVTMTGHTATVDISGANAAQYRLGGDGVINGSGLAADAIQLHADGDDGNDVLIGGAGDDTLLGGPGDDVLIGGPRPGRPRRRPWQQHCPSSRRRPLSAVGAVKSAAPTADSEK